MNGILVQVDGAEDKRHVFTGPFSIGSHPMADVCLEDPLVQIHHAEVTLEDTDYGPRWKVRRIGGLVVDTFRIQAAAWLHKGSRIEAGLTTLIVVPF